MINEMTEQLKLCKDCKWYRKDWIVHLTGAGDMFDTCHNPILSENKVTGKIKGGHYCVMMRLRYGKCGEEGKYWDARK